jgi:WD40 repeat protein
MSVSTAPILQSCVTPLACLAPVTGVAWLGGKAVFALGDGSVLIARQGHPERISLHDDAAILCLASSMDRILTGGEDGRVVQLTKEGTIHILHQPSGPHPPWIDAVALGPRGVMAFSMGRTVIACDSRGARVSWQAPSSARGLAFASKGYRLAIAHYNGASLWSPGTEKPPEPLLWRGSHLTILWSPDGRFVVTSMQENALHGWRLEQPAHMRMTGYPGRTRSLAFTQDGLWLATSGASGIILWPFATKEGPMGKAPRECGLRSSRVSQVVCHPHLPILAAGYEDGLVLLVRLTDEAELQVTPDTGESVTALAFSQDGAALAFGCENGTAGILELP